MLEMLFAHIGLLVLVFLAILIIVVVLNSYKKVVQTKYRLGSYYIASVHKLPEKLLVEKAKWAGTSVGYCIRVL